ncbi:unnamed protein product [Adineta ricciae]|uniref:TIR domain-containing protein n=1 Tax=Adineta ricciae TaxID=249248 RepID=A0A814MF52_ADIRI|nr:unnamed protein product [Adineta ricciae]
MFTAVHRHVGRLSGDQPNIKDNDLKSILTNVYDVFIEYGVINHVLTSQDSLNAMKFFCKHMVNNHMQKKILRAQIIDHEMFTLIRNTILSIVEKNNQLTEQDWDPFHAMAVLLTSALSPVQFDDGRVNRLVIETFCSDAFFNAVKQCMENLSSTTEQTNPTKYRILSYVFRHIYAHSKTYRSRIRILFLDLAVRCVTSKHYVDQFEKNEEASKDFFLLDCPSFVLPNSIDRHSEIAKTLCPSLLQDYRTILAYRIQRKSTDSHKNVYLTFYLKLLNFCTAIESTRDMFVQYIPSIITQIFTVLKDYLVLESDKAITGIKDEQLVITILTLIYNLLPNSAINVAIKENAPMSVLVLLSGKEQLQMTNGNFERKKYVIPKAIQIEAQNLLPLLMEDVEQLERPEEITRASVTCLAKAVKSESHMCSGMHASSVLMNMNTIVQNDQVKEQIVEQGALRLLSDCVCDPSIAIEEIRQPALGVIWTVSFNPRAACIWKTDQALIAQLFEIDRTNVNQPQSVANNILWQLVNEERFVATQSSIQRMLVLPNGRMQNSDDALWVNINTPGGEIVVFRENLTQEQKEMLKAEREQTASLPTNNIQLYEYDLMISYCHRNKDLCTVIYNCLSKMGKYRIWFDQEQMYGSTMDRMAEGIEKSHLFLVCMSSAYKNSNSCHKECEYADKRQHKVLFLKVEPNYTPNGWLGFYLGQQYYVDVTKPDFLTRFKDLIKQISMQRNETPDYSMLDKIVTADVQTAIANALQKKSEGKLGNSDTNLRHSVSTSTLSSVSSRSSLNFNDLAKTKIDDVSNNSKTTMRENMTSEKLAKYYPARYSYSNINDDQDSLNDIVVSISTPSMLSLSNEGDIVGLNDQVGGFKLDLLSAMMPQMNRDSIRVSDLSLNTERSSVNQDQSVKDWTRNDVLEFLQRINLMHVSVLSQDQAINGQRLLDFCESNLSPSLTIISTADYERLKYELHKLLSP